MDAWPHVAAGSGNFTDSIVKPVGRMPIQICLSVGCEWLGEKGDRRFLLSFQVCWLFRQTHSCLQERTKKVALDLSKGCGDWLWNVSSKSLKYAVTSQPAED